MLSFATNEKKHKKTVKVKHENNMKKFFITMFSNDEGTSHKRVLGTIGFISLVVLMFLTKSEISISAVEYVTIATVFGTVVEKFTTKAKVDTKSVDV